MSRAKKTRSEQRKKKKESATIKKFRIELIERPHLPIEGNVNTLEVGIYMVDEYEGKETNSAYSKLSSSAVIGNYLVEALKIYEQKAGGLLNLIPVKNSTLAVDTPAVEIPPVENEPKKESTTEVQDEQPKT